jgi:class 3 adenylate cyclase/YHS domain-containing protein
MVLRAVSQREVAEHTFLFADLAGYTAMTEAHGDEMAADAVTEFCRDVRELLPEFEAEQIKSIGDAVMVRVPEASAAIRLAVRLVGEVGTRHGSLAVRVGAHTGPAVQRDGDWFGAAVNLAARVAAVAERGEVVMTEVTHSAAGGAVAEYQIEARPGQAFKNVAEPVTIYALTLASQPHVANLPTDPVCRMAVDPNESPARRNCDGVDVWFCSPECAVVFDRHPDRYPVDTGP